MTYRRSRRARVPARPGPHVPDPCPLCAADLGGSGAVTRRRAEFAAEPGLFTWRCPECLGTWQERRVPAADGVSASTR